MQFLGKEVRDEEFPHINSPAGFETRVQEWFAQSQARALRNLGIMGALFMGISAFAVWRLAPGRVESALKAVKLI